VRRSVTTRFPHIDAVWAQGDDIAIGVLEAIKQAGREKEMWVVGGADRRRLKDLRYLNVAPKHVGQPKLPRQSF